ncbi:MAG: hypothetical protein IT184_11480 [Acidobacteria bacterium]|nr:hypothetical protein [Acidobacteriota bacterium]
MSQIGGYSGRPGRPWTPVWICEYPYPTMRLHGPSAECGDCPVWKEIEQERLERLTRDKAS